jgi:hypothetical protein
MKGRPEPQQAFLTKIINYYTYSWIETHLRETPRGLLLIMDKNFKSSYNGHLASRDVS